MNLSFDRMGELRAELRKASWVSIIMSVGGFAALVLFWWDMWDPESMLAIAVGSAIGVMVGTRRLVDPHRFAPIVRNKTVPVDGEETMDRLEPYWRQFPKALPLAWAFLATALVTVVIFLRQSDAAFHASGLRTVRGLFVGFGPTVLLCLGLFYLYALAKWREDSASSR